MRHAVKSLAITCGLLFSVVMLSGFEDIDRQKMFSFNTSEDGRLIGEENWIVHPQGSDKVVTRGRGVCFLSGLKGSGTLNGRVVLGDHDGQFWWQVVRSANTRVYVTCFLD